MGMSTGADGSKKIVAQASPSLLEELREPACVIEPLLQLLNAAADLSGGGPAAGHAQTFFFLTRVASSVLDALHFVHPDAGDARVARPPLAPV